LGRIAEEIVFEAVIWILRHGDAEPHEGKPDADRDLTEKGEQQSVNAGRALKKLGVELDVCLTSPL
jgi:phosphohistidine phosphatase